MRIFHSERRINPPRILSGFLWSGMALLGLWAFAISGCEHVSGTNGKTGRSSAPESTLEAVIPLTPLLPEASVKYAQGHTVPVQRAFFEAGAVKKEVIFQHPDCRIVFPPVPIHEGATLEFEIAINRAALDLPGDGVEFRAGIMGILGSRILYSEYIDPRKDPDSRGWLKRRVDLSAFAGSERSVFLETRNGPAGDGRNDWAGWHNPRVISDGIKATPCKRDDEYFSVLLIIIDTLRSDRLGCYGSKETFTPVIDSLAASGVLFERAFSHAPMTGPAHTAILTSMYPASLGVRINGNHLPDAPPTLAGLLGNSGYTTSAVVSLSVLDAGFGFDRGFDSYSDPGRRERYWENGDVVADRALLELEKLRCEPFFLWVHLSDPHEPYLPRHTDDTQPDMKLTLNGEPVDEFHFDEDALSIARFRLKPGISVLKFFSNKKPVFLGGGPVLFKVKYLKFLSQTPVDWKMGPGWIVLDDGPFRNGKWIRNEASVILENTGEKTLNVAMEALFKETLDQDHLNYRYDGEVEFADREIGRVLSKCRALGITDRLVVVLTADHGENLGDHGSIGHVHQLYDTLLHVPLIINYPGAPEGKRIHTQVRHLDIMPTILDLCGIPIPSYAEGRSLLPVINGKESEDRPAFAATFKPQAARDKHSLRMNGWEYVLTDELNMEELYDISEGPERDNLAAQKPYLCSSMRNWLDEWIATAERKKVNKSAVVPEKEKKGLEALGYVQ